MADFLQKILGGKKPVDTPVAAKADSGTCLCLSPAQSQIKCRVECSNDNELPMLAARNRELVRYVVSD
jgi:hypothetical protein